MATISVRHISQADASLRSSDIGRLADIPSVCGCL